MKRLTFLGALLVAAPGSVHAQPNATAAADKGPPAEAGAPEAAEAPEATKILVIPYQPIFRSAKQKSVDKATGYLSEELGSKDTIQVLRAGVAIEGQPQPSMDAVNEALEKAAAAEADHRIGDAIELRSRIINLMTQNASALPDDATFILAHHQLARALMWAGRDEDAKKMIDVAARMEPKFELPANEYSRLYRKWFRSRRKDLRREPRGELLVRSVLPGAIISIDGREMDVAPIKLTQVLPGKHLISAKLDGVAPSRTVVQVDAREAQEATIGFGETVGGPSIGAVADAVTENKLPTSAVQAAETAGRAAEAEWVVLGGLAKDGDHFNVHTYLLKVGSGKLAPINVTQFDSMLLTAESDVLRVVLGIEKALDQFDGAVAQVNMIEKKIRPSKVVNEMSGEPDLSKPERGSAGPTKGGRKIGPVKPTDDLDIED